MYHTISCVDFDRAIICQNFYQHHHEQALQLERSCFHEVLPVFSILSVFPCWVEAKVKRSASKVRSQVWRGRPGGRLQSLGSPLMETLSALVISSDVYILATCPKNRIRVAWMSWDSWGGEPAWSRTVALVTWSVYGMRRIRRKHILYKKPSCR